MKKVVIKYMFFAIIFSMGFSFINVYAYEENAFTDETCITNTDWTSTSKTEYKLNQETGKFELLGSTYEQASTENENASFIFYGVSNDGKTLYAYVPNYKNNIADNAPTKDIIGNAGIILTKDCNENETLLVSKTVIGNDPEENSGSETISGDNNNQSSNNAINSDINDAKTIITTNNPKTGIVDYFIYTTPIFIIAGIALVLNKNKNSNI